MQSGDAHAGSAVVWTRADQVSRMVVEVSDRPDLRDARTLPGPLLTPDTDFTGKVRVHGCTTTGTRKVVANDLPLGLVVPDGPTAFEGVAQGQNGAPLGRELEFAQVLRDAYEHGVTGIVFLTADVHYTAAHQYDPARAAVGDFAPFWEFVSGPANVRLRDQDGTVLWSTTLGAA